MKTRLLIQLSTVILTYMQLPSVKSALSTLAALPLRFVRSAGGWLAFLTSVAWLLLLGILRPVLEIFAAEKTVRENAWLRLLRLVARRLLKTPAKLWDLAVRESETADHLTFGAATIGSPPWKRSAHNYVENALVLAGMESPEQRTRLIQAVVWHRRVNDWLRGLRN